MAEAVVGAEPFTGRSRYRNGKDIRRIAAQGDSMSGAGLEPVHFHRSALRPHLDAVPGMSHQLFSASISNRRRYVGSSGPVSGYAICRAAICSSRVLFVADIVYFEGENAPVEAPTLACSNPPRRRG